MCLNNAPTNSTASAWDGSGEACAIFSLLRGIEPCCNRFLLCASGHLAPLSSFVAHCLPLGLRVRLCSSLHREHKQEICQGILSGVAIHGWAVCAAQDVSSS